MARSVRFTISHRCAVKLFRERTAADGYMRQLLRRNRCTGVDWKLVIEAVGQYWAAEDDSCAGSGSLAVALRGDNLETDRCFSLDPRMAL